MSTVINSGYMTFYALLLQDAVLCARNLTANEVRLKAITSMLSLCPRCPHKNNLYLCLWRDENIIWLEGWDLRAQPSKIPFGNFLSNRCTASVPGWKTKSEYRLCHFERREISETIFTNMACQSYGLFVGGVPSSNPLQKFSRTGTNQQEENAWSEPYK